MSAGKLQLLVLPSFLTDDAAGYVMRAAVPDERRDNSDVGEHEPDL